MRDPVPYSSTASAYLFALLACMLGGCGSGSHTRAARVDPLGLQKQALRLQGYAMSSRIETFGVDGTALYVYRSVCNGSADGHCQAVDAFRGTQTHAVWHRQYVDVRSIKPTQGGFAVTFSAYRSNDPLCCPSLPPKTTRFLFTGQRIVETK
ncbi:MAG: hypothetical protein PVSMB7_26960 [Chloroflexota bacterium]